MDRPGHVRGRSRPRRPYRDARGDHRRGERRRAGDVVARLPRPQGARGPDPAGDPRAATAMIDVPEIHYARNGDVHLAYQVFGEGERDLLYLWAPWSNIDLAWENPRFVTFLRRMS